MTLNNSSKRHTPQLAPLFPTAAMLQGFRMHPILSLLVCMHGAYFTSGMKTSLKEVILYPFSYSMERTLPPACLGIASQGTDTAT